MFSMNSYRKKPGCFPGRKYIKVENKTSQAVKDFKRQYVLQS